MKPRGARPHGAEPGTFASWPVGAAKPGTAWTLLVEGDEGALSRVLLTGSQYVIGRDAASEVPLDQNNVSRQHAVLTRDASGGWYVGDAGSRYGTFRNGQRLDGPALFGPRDLVQIGDFLLTLADAAGEQPDERALGLPDEGAAADADPTAWRPDRLLVFGPRRPDGGSEGPVRAVRLDQGPVHLGTVEGCAVRVPAFGVGTARLVVRPLIGSEAEGRADAAGQPLVGPHYEVLDTSEVPCLLVNGSPTRRKVLDDGDCVTCAGAVAPGPSPRPRRWGSAGRRPTGPWYCPTSASNRPPA